MRAKQPTNKPQSGKQATRDGDQQKEWMAHVSHRLREGAFILTVAVSLFLLIALITYHRTDPGWSETGQTKVIANAAGRVGAWLSDLLLYITGYLAYVFPLMLGYLGWIAFIKRPKLATEEWHYYFLLLRVAGCLLVLASGCALVSLYFHGGHSKLPFSTGGIMGNVISLGMRRSFNFVGTELILWSILLAGFTLFTGLSWIKVAEGAGRYLVLGAEQLWQRWRERQAGDVFPDEKNKPVEAAPKANSNKPAVKVEPKISSAPPAKPISNPPIAATSPVIVAPSKKIETSPRAEKERQTNLFNNPNNGSLPSLSLLDLPDKSQHPGYSHDQLEAMSREVEMRLQDFGVEVKVVAVHPGPVVTRFELQLAAGTKVSRISNLAKDLARSLSVTSVRIVEVIPGKSVIGLELPNEHREVVRLREILASSVYDSARSPVTLALGKDISGHPVIVDLAKMPHLLVAGTTGSGKSVGLNAMLLSLLYKSSPQELRLIMIDPKMLELSIYDGIPHLLVPVVTDMKEASNALRWCVAEMERRYRLMASLGVRNISGYNSKVREAAKKSAPLLDPLWQQSSGSSQPELQELPFIVVLADEFADMMMVVGKKVEELIARLAQKARAAGIHLILATQRPSVDVITGLIKANIPTRIAFQVSSKIDSRTILDQSGAEQLLGHGDMLYLAPGTGVPVRVHGAYVADEEVHRVVSDLKSRGEPEYLTEILQDTSSDGGETGSEGGDAEKDPLYDQAVQIVLETRRASISGVQRRLKIGYNRAARIIEAMEAAGLVSAMDNSGGREVLVPESIG